MKARRVRWGIAALLLGALVTGVSVGAAGIPKDTAAIEHALNRVAYGPRPGDVERVQRIGLAAWIEQQLHPAAIDDSALKARLPEQPARPTDVTDPMVLRQWGRQSVQALGSEKVIRAIYSERQLEEQLVDFWFNHFNVFAGKGRTSQWVVDYERTAIRPHVFGKFRDLLEATAKSPAMLFYLDNWLSADPEAAEQMQRRPAAARRPNGAGNPQQPQQQQQQAQQRRRGLNENYARELLELHTLGVDGGYTQKDIVEVARAFTGWTIAPARLQQQQRPGLGRLLAGGGAVQEGEFIFTPRVHDTGEKIVLGQKIKAGGGIEDGERVLDIVARHPSTAHHIAYQLAQRFVADEPPKALVDRAAKKFRDTDGDLREVVRTIITSDEFFSPQARGAKVKTPLEFLASGMRATAREVRDASLPERLGGVPSGPPARTGAIPSRQLLRALMEMGMPPYMCQPPTGYDNTADTWVSAGALVARMNIAQQIAGPQKAASIGGPEFQRR
jgi:uncharacterized protein (DUF1800 family)